MNLKIKNSVPIKDNLDTKSISIECDKKYPLWFLNSCRRGLDEFIPNYAFTDETINIIENTTIYFDDQIKMFIKAISLWSYNFNQVDSECITPLIEFYYDQFKNNIGDDILLPDIKHDRIIMTLDIENNTSQTLMLTTKYANFYNNNNKIKNFFLRDNFIMELRPSEIIKLSAETTIQIPKFRTEFASVRKTALCDNVLMFSNRRFFEDKDILLQLCDIFLILLTNCKKNKKEKKNDEETIIYRLPRTIGQLIAGELREKGLNISILYSRPSIDYCVFRHQKNLDLDIEFPLKELTKRLTNFKQEINKCFNL